MKNNRRKNKTMLSVYIDTQLHDHLKERAKFRGLPLSKWILRAISMLIDEEKKYE